MSSPSAPPVRVVFISGASRSGSTLLDRVVGTTAGAVSLGELDQVWHRGLHENHLCGCGVPFRSCTFWTEVLTRASGRTEGFDVERLMRLRRRVLRTWRAPLFLTHGVLSPTWQAQREEYASAMAALYLAVRDVAGCDVVVDSSKRPVYGLLFRHRRDVCLHTVHIVRDSRAVAFSQLRRRLKPEVVDRLAYMHRWTPRHSALGWLRANALAAVLGRLTGSYRLVRYEDFVADPARVVGQIATDVGLMAAPFIVDDVIDLGVAHTVSGNPMRMEATVRIQPDDEWRSGMRPTDRRLVSVVTSPMLAWYRYIPARRRARSRWL